MTAFEEAIRLLEAIQDWDNHGERVRDSFDRNKWYTDEFSGRKWDELLASFRKANQQEKR